MYIYVYIYITDRQTDRHTHTHTHTHINKLWIVDASETKCFYIFIIYLYNIYMFIIIYKKRYIKTSNKNGLDFLHFH